MAMPTARTVVGHTLKGLWKFYNLFYLFIYLPHPEVVVIHLVKDFNGNGEIMYG